VVDIQNDLVERGYLVVGIQRTSYQRYGLEGGHRCWNSDAAEKIGRMEKELGKGYNRKDHRRGFLRRPHMRVLKEFRNRFEAESFGQFLDNENIPYVIQSDDAGGQRPAALTATLLVSEGDFERATAILDATRTTKR
jgi:hypothetical protein